jgi:hypothetical protein
MLRASNPYLGLRGTFADPVSLGGKPVCCVRIRPLAGVEFLRRALWYPPPVIGW